MKKKAILCVDDEKIILDSIREQLQGKYGNQYIYESAQSADEAWEILLEFEADEIDVLLIFSDWLMPGIKGDEFLIKVHKKFPKVIKVLLTCQADRESVMKAEQSADLFKCISKPWDQNELYETVEFSLGSRTQNE